MDHTLSNPPMTPGGTEDVTGEACPLCLHPMSAADVLYPLQCPTATCSYNFCLGCLERFLRSSQDDYEMASDGNRHVKVRLNCPSCRAEIARTIQATMATRRRAVARALRGRSDGELSAKELQQKYWKEEDGVLLEKKGEGEEKGRTQYLDIDPTLFGGLETLMSEEEQKFVTSLMTSGEPDDLSKAAQILAGIAELIRNGNSPARHGAANARQNHGHSNETAGASRMVAQRHFNPNNSNRRHTIPNAGITSNPTQPVEMRHGYSNAGLTQTRVRERERIASLQKQKANAHMRHGYSNAGLSQNHRREGERISTIQKQMEAKAREKVRRPLPARMPLHVALRAGEFEAAARRARERPAAPAESPGWFRGLLGLGAGGPADALTFIDDAWDGSLADAFARARLGPGDGRVPVVRSREGPRCPAERRGVRALLAAGEREGRPAAAPGRPRRRVLVASVRGPAGKAGVQRGDVVTHVDGQAFAGDAAALAARLVRAYDERGPEGVVAMVVNAEECTAAALRLRSYVR